MMRWLLVLGFSLWAMGTWPAALYPFDNMKQQAQFQSLLHDLRCPVCQNQDLADSTAGVAADLRQEVYHLVLEHHSDQEIIHYLKARYGDFILFKPPLMLTTTILWFGPVALLLLGLGLFAWTCVRRTRHV